MKKFLKTYFYPNGSGIFALLWVILAMTFIFFIVWCG